MHLSYTLQESCYIFFSSYLCVQRTDETVQACILFTGQGGSWGSKDECQWAHEQWTFLEIACKSDWQACFDSLLCDQYKCCLPYLPAMDECLILSLMGLSMWEASVGYHNSTNNSWCEFSVFSSVSSDHNGTLLPRSCGSLVEMHSGTFWSSHQAFYL